MRNVKHLSIECNYINNLLSSNELKANTSHASKKLGQQKCRVSTTYDTIDNFIWLLHRRLQLIRVLLWVYTYHIRRVHWSECLYHQVNQFISLSSSDPISRHRYESTLAQWMACCLKAPNPNQWWFILEGVPWYSQRTTLQEDLTNLSLKCILSLM